jgi:hypothetical protein
VGDSTHTSSLSIIICCRGHFASSSSTPLHHRHLPLSIIVLCSLYAPSTIIRRWCSSFLWVVGWLWFIVGVGCGVVVVVGSVVVFSELERDEQGMGVLTWYPKIQNNDER